MSLYKHISSYTVQPNRLYLLMVGENYAQIRPVQPGIYEEWATVPVHDGTLTGRFLQFTVDLNSIVVGATCQVTIDAPDRKYWCHHYLQFELENGKIVSKGYPKNFKNAFAAAVLGGKVRCPRQKPTSRRPLRPGTI